MGRWGRLGAAGWPQLGSETRGQLEHGGAERRRPDQDDTHERREQGDDGQSNGGDVKKIDLHLTCPGGEFGGLAPSRSRRVDHRGLEPRTSTMPLWRSPR